MRKSEREDSFVRFTPLIRTSQQSGKIPVPTFFDVQREWSGSDFLYPHQVIGGVQSVNLPAGATSHLVVFTDGDFALGSQGRGQNPDNISLISNAIDWLSDDTGLIDLRTKGVATRPIKEMEDAERTSIKWTNFLLPNVFLVFPITDKLKAVAMMGV